MGTLEGKTVLVTGGANGIGRECALLAAREGAKVVVNDLGGGIRGDDLGDTGPAELVVREIRAAGGEAVANPDSVADPQGVRNMVDQALDTFGALHAIINPAGILRDAMFHKMSDDDWDRVLQVHLNGAYLLCKTAMPYFRAQAEGAFVLFGSTSGLIGNLGQANYAAAKMGVVGLSRILAMEGAQKNIRSNVIAPFAWTRMIGTIPVKDEASAERVERMQRTMRADQVAQLAVALASPGAAEVNGQIFVARGNEVVLMSQPRPVRSIANPEGWTPESLIKHGLPGLKPEFFEPVPSASIFSWDPM